jgi:hypothetical protein
VSCGVAKTRLRIQRMHSPEQSNSDPIVEKIHMSEATFHTCEL